MSTGSAKSTAGILLGLLIAAVIMAALIVSVIAVGRIDVSGDSGSGLASTFDYDIEKYKRVDPKLIHYRQVAEFPVAMKAVRAVAIGPDDQLYVAGDRRVDVLSPAGKRVRQIVLVDQPRCLAVGGEDHVHSGRTYVGIGDHIETFAADGSAVANWPGRGPKVVLTSIALAEEDVFVADAGNRVVWRYDAQGELIGKIGAPDPQRGIRGFVIPSPYFDVVVTHEPLLRVINPGARRIEAFTFDGAPMVHWGEAGPAIDRFFGCCNPSHMCLLPDGRFVTTEKGLPRVKVYSMDGEFQSVVAGPEQLAPTQTMAEETRSDHQIKVFDIAADSRGRILVLDPHKPSVRVFVKKGATQETQDER